jgi:hypothetical protein
MNSAFIYSFIIGFVGAALFLFVDKYERDGMVANLLKFLVLTMRLRGERRSFLTLGGLLARIFQAARRRQG